MSPLQCMGPKTVSLFSDRCRAPATYKTPSGYRCDVCAEREMQTIRDGACILAMIADARGTPREVLLAQYVRIQ